MENLADRINDLHDEISRNNDRIIILEQKLDDLENDEWSTHWDYDDLESEIEDLECMNDEIVFELSELGE